MKIRNSEKLCSSSFLFFQNGTRAVALAASLLLMSVLSPAEAAPAPTITKISPAVGTPTGGTVVTITGTNFVSGATVAFKQNSATAVTFVSSTSLKATAPASTNNAEGPVSISVTNPDTQIATLPNGFTYQYPVPTVTKISPAIGWPAGGTVVTITGTNFLSGATVSFGQNSATSVTFQSQTSLKATTPPSTNKADGAVNVTVTNPDSQAATLSNGFMYQYPAPAITTLSPITGLPTGGTVVTITGTNFLLGATVAFGQNSATKVTFVSKTTLTATAPASTNAAEGPVNVTVTNPDSQTATLSNGFTYQLPAPTVTKLTPISGPVTGATIVTITGANFVSGATVAFGQKSATNVTFVSKTTLTATAPASTNDAAGTVNVTVTNPDSETGTLSNGYTYQLPPPTITKISPTVASANGGTVITITGTNFLAGATVAFGSSNATAVTFVSKTQLKATAPASTLSNPGAEGSVSVFVTNPDNQGATLSQGLTYDDPPEISSVSPAHGTPAGGYTVTLNGQNFRCDPSCPSGPVVTFGTTPATSVIYNSGTSMTVTVPAAAAAGPVNVIEKNTDGLSTTLKNGFTYSSVLVTQVSPGMGPLSGGNTVTIQGSGFTTGTTVKFGATAATSVDVTSATSLTAMVPAHVGGFVTLTVSNSNGTGALPEAYQYTEAPLITGVSPASGPSEGGSSVNVNGFNLETVSSVLFGGNAATIVSTASGTVTVTAPAYSGGTNPVPVQVTATNGSKTMPAAYTYQLETTNVSQANYFFGISKTVGQATANLVILDPGTDPAGHMCADIYVFNPSEEMEACCSCPITPDEIITGSVIKDLLSNLLNGNTLNNGVIKIISSATDDNGKCVTGEIPIPIPGLVAWLTRVDSPVPFGTGGTTAVTTTPFADAPLSPAEFNTLAHTCAEFVEFGSGFGKCLCPTKPAATELP